MEDNPRFPSLDEDERLPPDVVSRFMQDNVPPSGIDAVGYPKAVVLEDGADTTAIPDNTLIVFLPEDYTP